MAQKRKHPNKSFNSYEHGLAAYPLEFYRFVVSENKICLQFKDVQLKARPVGSTDDLQKGPKGSKQLNVNTRGTDVGVLAVGIPLDMYPELLENIQEALKQNEKRCNLFR